VRSFWIALFAIGAVTVLVFGFRDGVPWTASAFVAFFVSRVWRSVIKRPLMGGGPAAEAHAPEETLLQRTNRFIIVTAGGYLGAGVFAAIAASVGEGQEWLYVAPCFLIMGALQLALLSSRGQP
jgi:hypothetical protein